MSKHNVDILIKARDAASAAFRTAGASATGFGGKMAGLFNQYKYAFAGLAVGAAAFAKKSIDAFTEQEQAAVELDQALRVLGDTSDESRRRAAEFAGSIQKVSIYGDEAVLQLQAMGVNMGKLTGLQLERATKAAIGLSRAYKLDVNSAMQLVSRAAQGQTQMLSRYGIVLDKNLTPRRNSTSC